MFIVHPQFVLNAAYNFITETLEKPENEVADKYKKVKAEIKNENKELATAKFNEANKKIDKAVKAGVIKKNTAARNKSKLMKAINNIK